MGLKNHINQRRRNRQNQKGRTLSDAELIKEGSGYALKRG